jgi:hypothetical protein
MSIDTPPAHEPAVDLSGLSEGLAAQWGAATKELRARADITSKALGGLGTTGLTAAGLTKFSDIFPLPATPSTWQDLAIAAIVAGLVAMAGAVAWFTMRLSNVSSPIFMRLDPEEMATPLKVPRGRSSRCRAENPDIDECERALVDAIYLNAARLNGAANLQQYALRGLRLQRIAQRSADKKVSALAAVEAKQINADVAAAQARALTNIVRGRADNAIRGKRALAAYSAFFIGLLAFGFATDYLDSERTQRITTAKSCGEAITAIRTADPDTPSPPPAALLPALCGGKAAVPKGAAPPPATAAAAVSGAVKSLGAQYDACVTAAKGDASQCSSIKAAIRTMLP